MIVGAGVLALAAAVALVLILGAAFRSMGR